MGSVFVDTDVILDLFIRREPHHGVAVHFFSRMKGRRDEVRTSPVAVANTYYILAKVRNRQYALEKLRRLRQLLGIAAVDQKTVDAALAAPHKDFEDSIQYHCAMSSAADLLVTRNVSDYPRGPLRVVSPEEYLKMADAAPRSGRLPRLGAG